MFNRKKTEPKQPKQRKPRWDETPLGDPSTADTLLMGGLLGLAMKDRSQRPTDYQLPQPPPMPPPV